MVDDTNRRAKHFSEGLSKKIDQKEKNASPLITERCAVCDDHGTVAI